MWQDHFTYKGNTYYTGAVFKVKECEYILGVYETEAAFVTYSPKKKQIVFKVNGKLHTILFSNVHAYIVAPTDKKDNSVHCPVKKQKSEFAIEGMHDAWIWYVVLMAITTIFKGNIFYWGLISWVFFSWRSKKIKNEGYYYDWEK